MRLKMDLKNEKGAAAVEFALVLPILILLLIGIIQFGQLYNAYITVTHAAREGARMASVPGEYSTAKVESRATPLNPVTISGPPDGFIGNRGDPVTVTVTYNYSLNIPFYTKNGIIPITSSATMRIE